MQIKRLSSVQGLLSSINKPVKRTCNLSISFINSNTIFSSVHRKWKL